MTHFTICYSARGTGVLRTERLLADEQAAIAQVKRRLGASRTFQEARVFEDGELRFKVSSDPCGVSSEAGGPSWKS